jgi:hypothetical protein
MASFPVSTALGAWFLSRFSSRVIYALRIPRQACGRKGFLRFLLFFFRFFDLIAVFSARSPSLRSFRQVLFFVASSFSFFRRRAIVFG